MLLSDTVDDVVLCNINTHMSERHSGPRDTQVLHYLFHSEVSTFSDISRSPLKQYCSSISVLAFSIYTPGNVMHLLGSYGMQQVCLISTATAGGARNMKTNILIVTKIGLNYSAFGHNFFFFL